MSKLKTYLLKVWTSKSVYEIYADSDEATYEYICDRDNTTFKGEPIKKVVFYKRYGNTDTFIEIAKQQRIKENN